MFVAIPLHLLATVIWVGGMFFAYMALRPVAASLLEPPQRLPLWSQTFDRFFPWVWAAVISLSVTGLWMVYSVFGGFGHVGLYIYLMTGIGSLMILLFLHVFFLPYRRMQQALATNDLPEAGRRLAQIRVIIGINLVLGLLVTVVAGAGRFI
ncbi:MAG: CopD family protein [Porticoccus sp.]|nr:CopD family protein [Porticoccus sp.]